MSAATSIGILGFGRFGALMTRHLSPDFVVKVYDRRHRTQIIADAGGDATTFEVCCNQDIVILGVPISVVETVLHRAAPLLRPDALVVDVCSVKMLPVQWMRSCLPETVGILATHPMFGPDSAANGLKGHKIVVCPERIDRQKYAHIQKYLRDKGLIVIETTPEDHDRQIAVSLALTHFIGRALAEFGAKPHEIDTEGYKRLLHTLEVVTHDTWQLFEDMHHYNPYAQSQRELFLGAAERIHSKLDHGNDKEKRIKS